MCDRFVCKRGSLSEEDVEDEEDAGNAVIEIHFLLLKTLLFS